MGRGIEVGCKAWLASHVLDEPPPEPYVMVTVKANEGPSQVRVTLPASVKPPPYNERSVQQSALSPICEGTVTDMVMLLNLSEATVLDNMITRYNKGEPYTYTGEILTSVNPCKPVAELYSAPTMCSYAGRLLGGGRPPHLYAMAEEAYRLVSAAALRTAMVKPLWRCGKRAQTFHAAFNSRDCSCSRRAITKAWSSLASRARARPRPTRSSCSTSYGERRTRPAPSESTSPSRRAPSRQRRASRVEGTRASTSCHGRSSTAT